MCRKTLMLPSSNQGSYYNLLLVISIFLWILREFSVFIILVLMFRKLLGKDFAEMSLKELTLLERQLSKGVFFIKDRKVRRKSMSHSYTKKILVPNQKVFDIYIKYVLFCRRSCWWKNYDNQKYRYADEFHFWSHYLEQKHFLFFFFRADFCIEFNTLWLLAEMMETLAIYYKL